MVSKSKNKVFDCVMTLIGRRLPHRSPAFDKLKDDDYITLLSWCEDWEPEKVYKTAYKQSHIDYIQTWDEWSVDMKPLPLVVREELKRALIMHERRGNLMSIRAYAWFYDLVSRLATISFWALIIVTFLYWIA